MHEASQDQVDFRSNEGRQPLEVALGPSIIDLDVTTFNITVRAHPFEKGDDVLGRRGWGASSEITDPSRPLI
jgi:hypothetical protein